MSSRFRGRVPTMWYGSEITQRITKRLTEGYDALVIADEAIAGTLQLGQLGRVIEVNASSLDSNAVVNIAHAISHRRPHKVVAVGGGAVLDATKIAALAIDDGRMFDFAINHARRSALTLLPHSQPPVDVIAIPTTLGTSSETNSVAILKCSRGFRLIVGRSLRPRHSILDSENLMSLSVESVLEGSFEAFLRVAGISTSPLRSPRAYQDAITIGGALIYAASMDASSRQGRLRIARLSAATQRTGALFSRDPYGARHWYLANEVSYHLGTRKMPASAAIISAVWKRILRGDLRWGDRESLQRFWSGASHGQELPHDPVAGIIALMDRWGVRRAAPPSFKVVDRIAAAVEQSWGNRHPMLRGIRVVDVLDILQDSCWDKFGREISPTIPYLAERR